MFSVWLDRLSCILIAFVQRVAEAAAAVPGAGEALSAVPVVEALSAVPVVEALSAGLVVVVESPSDPLSPSSESSELMDIIDFIFFPSSLSDSDSDSESDEIKFTVNSVHAGSDDSAPGEGKKDWVRLRFRLTFGDCLSRAIALNKLPARVMVSSNSRYRLRNRTLNL